MSREETLRQAVVEIADRCPRLAADCYWAGTSAIALEELHHRESFDLDFHTQDALVDTRPMLAELEREFPGAITVVSAPDRYGSGFTAILLRPGGEKLPVQVFAGFEHVPDSDLVPSSTAGRLRRVTLRRYLADKVQCVVERIEARDLADLAAILRRHPGLEGALSKAVAAQDNVLLAERLLAWTGSSIHDDLRAYPDIDPEDAIAMRDRILEIVVL